jgi:hypothetical protein
MNATRSRRMRDRARQVWYARHRQWRFARHFGFTAEVPVSGRSGGDRTGIADVWFTLPGGLRTIRPSHPR